MANVWSMAKPTRKCILAGDIIYAFDRKVSSRTFDFLGQTFTAKSNLMKFVSIVSMLKFFYQNGYDHTKFLNQPIVNSNS